MMIKRLKKEESLLVVIDFQEKLMPVMHEKEVLEAQVCKMVLGARALGVPVMVTQQYTKGLGATIPAVAMALGDFEAFEKTSFSAMGAPEFAEKLRSAGKKKIVIAGIEAHICVTQTALDLLEEGYEVFICGDCVSSRMPIDISMAKNRMREAGAVYTSMESVLFEWCGGAKMPGFKEISKIIK